MVKIQLPETFGTGTIHGLFYEKCGITEAPTPNETADFALTQINAALDQEILISLPILNFRQLGWLDREAESFINWAEKNFKKTPRLLFV